MKFALTWYLSIWRQLWKPVALGAIALGVAWEAVVLTDSRIAFAVAYVVAWPVAILACALAFVTVLFVLILIWSALELAWVQLRNLTQR